VLTQMALSLVKERSDPLQEGSGYAISLQEVVNELALQVKCDYYLFCFLSPISKFETTTTP
jgi:hypothetical protein